MTITHAEDGALLALIDGELDAAEAQALEAHVAQCAECAARLDSLRAATALTTAVLASYDVPAPSAPSRAIRVAARGREVRARLAAAAVLVLLVAAGAAALVPGSPVRAWLERLFADEPVTPQPMPASPVDSAPPVDDGPRGVTLGASDDVVVRVEPTGAPLDVRVVLSSGTRVSVRALDAAPAGFELGVGSVRVRPGAARRIEVTLPADAPSARVLLGERQLVRLTDGVLRVDAAGVRDDSIVHFSIEGAAP